MSTPVHKMQFTFNDNHFYMKRDDLLPYSFGGNKYRKAIHYFDVIDREGYDVVLTTGSASSNHCRIVANMAKQRNIDCIIVSPEESEKPAFNRTLTHWLDAKIVITPQDTMREVIKTYINDLKTQGKKPYYIKMGGHGYLGTKAYVEAYQEIHDTMTQAKPFDYIFFADGTGTTHAGLCAGKTIQSDQTQIIGIGVLKTKEEALSIIEESVNEYLSKHGYKTISQDAITYEDAYLLGGYGHYDASIIQTIKTIMQSDGIPLDPVYTGKGFYGMIEYIRKHNIKRKNILFIHTGGTPIFFDMLNACEKT